MYNPVNCEGCNKPTDKGFTALVGEDKCFIPWCDDCQEESDNRALAAYERR